MSTHAVRIKPFHPNLIPPKGAVRAGMTPDGQQLWRLDRKRSSSEPAWVLDPKTGKPVLDDFGNKVRDYKKNHNGDPYLPKRVPRFYVEHKRFFLESMGNGNVKMTEYKEPTPEEKAAAERERKVAAMGGGALGQALVDAGITDPGEIVRRLSLDEPQQESEQAVAPSVEDDAEPEVEFPVDRGDGLWFLSDGSSFEGTREEAEAAEADVPKTEEVASY